MAKGTKTTKTLPAPVAPAPVAQVTDHLPGITAEITKITAAYLSVDALSRAAKARAAQAADTSVSNQEKLLAACSILAIKHSWPVDQIGKGIEAAIAAAVEAFNADPANAKAPRKVESLRTWSALVARACHPFVRPHVVNFIKATRAAWKLEDTKVAEAAETDTPHEHALKKIAARPIQVVGKLMTTAKGDGTKQGKVYETPNTIVAYAEANDPAFDAKRAAKDVAKVRAMLTSVHARFPYQGLATILKYLDPATMPELPTLLANARKEARIKAQTASINPANVLQPAEGAFDYGDLDDEEDMDEAA